MICKKEKLISKNLGICLDCIRQKQDEVSSFVKKIHKAVREKFNLPPFPPKASFGIRCNFCENNCIVGEGQKSYCGLKENVNGKWKSKINSEKAIADFYYDPIPTNCCAEWFCQANKNGFGKYNLAVFFYGCSFNCLFCQNYTHKYIEKGPVLTLEKLINYAENHNVYCVCFFGGSPEPQMPFVIKFSEEILKRRKIRICFEWNGSGNENFVKKAGEIALRSHGIIKFDLKAFDENLNFVLTGVSNKRTLENFKLIAEEFLPKADYYLLTATTLLVPGYIDEKEIENISKFISSLNPNIPYSLLVFHPEFFLNDLPITPKDLVFKCFEIAKKYLRNVHIGNIHLLDLF